MSRRDDRRLMDGLSEGRRRSGGVCRCMRALSCLGLFEVLGKMMFAQAVLEEVVCLF